MCDIALKQTTFSIHRGHFSLYKSRKTPYSGRGMGCREWVQIWPKFYHCSCCAACTIASYMTAIYRESLMCVYLCVYVCVICHTPVPRFYCVHKSHYHFYCVHNNVLQHVLCIWCYYVLLYFVRNDENKDDQSYNLADSTLSIMVQYQTNKMVAVSPTSVEPAYSGTLDDPCIWSLYAIRLNLNQH